MFAILTIISYLLSLICIKNSILLVTTVEFTKFFGVLTLINLVRDDIKDVAEYFIHRVYANNKEDD